MSMGLVLRSALTAGAKELPLLGYAYNLISEYQNSKVEYFIEEFEKELISQENIPEAMKMDYFHNAYVTLSIITKIRQLERIQIFAKIFAAYTNCINTSGDLTELHDDYEEYAYILESLTIREFTLLNILYKYEIKENIKLDCKNILQSVIPYWGDFLNEVTSTLNMDMYNVNGMLSKLNGTGLYQTIHGGYMGYTGNKGHLTPLCYKIIEFITNNCKKV